jgi:hypothetical protein
LNNTENWITLTSIKTRGEIRCPIANTRVNHSKKAKLNIMHVTMNFLGLFFRTSKIFFGLTRFSCLSVRMTDNFSASFGKSDVTVNFLGLFFRTGKIFFGLTRFSCLSVRMTDNFSAGFGKSVNRQNQSTTGKLWNP